jgi:hypothetical protein
MSAILQLVLTKTDKLLFGMEKLPMELISLTGMEDIPKVTVR